MDDVGNAPLDDQACSAEQNTQVECSTAVGSGKAEPDKAAVMVPPRNAKTSNAPTDTTEGSSKWI